MDDRLFDFLGLRVIVWVILVTNHVIPRPPSVIPRPPDQVRGHA